MVDFLDSYREVPFEGEDFTAEGTEETLAQRCSGRQGSAASVSDEAVNVCLLNARLSVTINEGAEGYASSDGELPSRPPPPRKRRSMKLLGLHLSMLRPAAEAPAAAPPVASPLPVDDDFPLVPAGEEGDFAPVSVASMSLFNDMPSMVSIQLFPSTIGERMTGAPQPGAPTGSPQRATSARVGGSPAAARPGALRSRKLVQDNAGASKAGGTNRGLFRAFRRRADAPPHSAEAHGRTAPPVSPFNVPSSAPPLHPSPRREVLRLLGGRVSSPGESLDRVDAGRPGRSMFSSGS
jgi:hypothetical protein